MDFRFRCIISLIGGFAAGLLALLLCYTPADWEWWAFVLTFNMFVMIAIDAIHWIYRRMECVAAAADVADVAIADDDA